MAVDRNEYIIQRQGKDMVLFKGLLKLAHDKEFKGIRTELIDKHYSENEKGVYEPDYALVHAIVTDNEGREWHGIGDADRANVNRNIAPHLIRMAETRAKARAMRDALNIGEVSDAELMGGEYDEEERPPTTSKKGSQSGSGGSRGQRSDTTDTDKERGPLLSKVSKEAKRVYGSAGVRVLTTEKAPEKLKGKKLSDWPSSALNIVLERLKGMDDHQEGEESDEIDVDNVPGVEKGGAAR